MSSDAFAERILGFVQAKGYKPRKLHELARTMGIGEDEQGDFHAACKALMKTGRVILGTGSALMPPAPPGKFVGTYRGNERGFGFVIPDTPHAHGDLFVPSGASGDAITGDTVVATVRKRGKRDGRMLYEGRIVEIVKRGRSRFVGELSREVQRWFVIPDGNTLHVPIMVGDPGAKNARAGDQVVVEIVQYPGERREARGVIVKTLGRRGKPGVDTLSIIEQHQLPGEFPAKVRKETQKAIARFDPEKEAERREDLRGLTVITIDPVDARDYDDAISLTSLQGGAVELGVHIADVAHFVPVGGALDIEAKARSTSVYLSRTVIPMVPEVLSNGLCSLQERESRLTKSVFITYSRAGKVQGVRAANTIVRSAKRLTYEQASAILDGKRGRFGAKVVALVKSMERLAKAIHRRRQQNGMLELDLPEVKLVFDDDGAAIDVVPEDTSYSHKIIEMFMVEANEAVARILLGDKVPFLQRVHPEPREMAADNLRRFLGILGHVLPKGSDRFTVQALLKKVRGKSDAFAVHLAVLRSMQQAEYAPTRIGHYALASKHYAHFTSPIRRYPDLTIHRLLDQHLAGELKGRRGKGQTPTEEEVTALGRLCSTNERRAEAAERELKLVMILRLLQEKHLGDEFDGIVTGVANVGVFVQLGKFLVDGLVRFNQLADDWWEVDPSRGCVVGERTGHRITVGDQLKVVIARVNLPTRQMDLAPATPLHAAKGNKAAQSTGSGKRGRKRKEAKKTSKSRKVKKSKP